MRLKFIFLIGLALTCCFRSFSQKKLLDIDLPKYWPEVRFIGISNDGRYMTYTVDQDSVKEVILQSTIDDRKLVIQDAATCRFTQSNKQMVFQRRDSIGIVALGGEAEVSYIPGVTMFSLIRFGLGDDFLLYRKKGEEGKLFVKDMQNGEIKVQDSVKRYWPMRGLRSVIMEINVPGEMESVLTLFDPVNGKSEVIWKGRSINQLLIDDSANKVVFSSKRNLEEEEESLWIYRSASKRVQEFAKNRLDGLKDGQILGNLINFDGWNERVLVDIVETKQDTAVGKGVSVDVWSYKDEELQSEQLAQTQRGSVKESYKGVINIATGKVVQLEFKNERLLSIFCTGQRSKFALVERHGPGRYPTEWRWNESRQSTVYLVSLESGRRKVVGSGLAPSLVFDYVLSYEERYVYYFDAQSSNYFCYRIEDGKCINMTKELPYRWINLQYADEPDARYAPYRIAGFIKNSDAILIYDQQGIVELNPDAEKKAKDLVGNRSSNRNLEIRMTSFNSESIVDSELKIPFNISDRSTKQRGIVNVGLDSLKFVRFKLFLKPFSICWTGPAKALDTNLYIINAMTDKEPGNLFCTSDFKHYHRLTNINPSTPYNWLTAELVTWKTFDGKEDQGVLYKPEDFDPLKKYPLLIYYYEKLSDGLRTFHDPHVSTGEIDIPFYVSHGYLVFTPDIHYTVGFPGKSAYNAIVSGAVCLSKRKYVDRKRMGLQGISFGGFETDYVITHSNLFAAAMSSSSMTDFISAYGSIIGDGVSRQSQYELYRDRIGATLWERPDLYKENSPVLRADHITTPLLMMANRLDDDVPAQQGMELFTGMRRLGKKVWLLQYDNEGHHVYGEQAMRDLTIRMFQFFNYYLKGDPPPQWMTKGIPAELKGVDTGLELDTSGAKP